MRGDRVDRFALASFFRSLNILRLFLVFVYKHFDHSPQFFNYTRISFVASDGETQSAIVSCHLTTQKERGKFAKK